jgi:uncharacterized membrane protein
MLRNRLLRLFVTGLLAALPLAATIVIFWWVARVLLRWLGPQSPVGQLFVALGLGVAGSEVLGYALGITFVAVIVLGLGLLVETGLQRGLVRLVDGVVGRIPLVRSVYELARRLVAVFSERQAGGLHSMGAVWCRFGGAPAAGAPARAAVLALLSTTAPVLIDGRAYVGVIVPSAPVPVGGALLYVPSDWVTPAALGVEALTSIYVSMGLTSAEHLGRPAPATPPPAPATAAHDASKAA